MAVKQTKVEKDVNIDPISGELGAQPVGTGVGAAMAGAAAGAAGERQCNVIPAVG